MLDITSVQLVPPVLKLLAPALKGKPIFKSLHLEDNKFTDARKGIEFVIEFIKSNQTLKKFNWMTNRIDSIDDANQPAIMSHPSIDHVQLDNCFGDNVISYDILRSLFTSNKMLQLISFEGNGISVVTLQYQTFLQPILRSSICIYQTVI